MMVIDLHEMMGRGDLERNDEELLIDPLSEEEAELDSDDEVF